MTAIASATNATMTRFPLFFLATCLIGLPAHAFEVAEFKSGMAQTEVKTLLIANWNFDRVAELSDDVILAYDNDPAIARRYQFRFCKGKLVGFEQDVRPSLKALIITTSNYNNQYGQPSRVYSNTHIVSNGEKAVFAMFWKNGTDTIGVKYIVLPSAEQMSLAFDSNNLCYSTPRM
ncbi:MAG: hypothetical protein PHD37_12835 [Gallionellaceae bacterium]|nr:hypothetical protein [Gallionellaceae bacterium]